MDKRGYDFSQSLEKKTFNFGPRNPGALSVDASLAGLFDCLTMECRYAMLVGKRNYFNIIIFSPCTSHLTLHLKLIVGYWSIPNGSTSDIFRCLRTTRLGSATAFGARGIYSVSKKNCPLSRNH